MTYWRTSRRHVGGFDHAGGSPDGSKYALPANSILSSGPSLELSEISKPSLDELEMGARGFLAVCLACLFTLLGILLAVAHALLVA